MRSRTVVLGLLAAALAIPTTLPDPADARQRAPTTGRASAHAGAGRDRRCSVVDVKVVRQPRLRRRQHPQGREVSRHGCRPARREAATASRCRDPAGTAPPSHRSPAPPPATCGPSARTAVGKLLRPVMWRKAGATWSVFRSGITVKASAERLQLTQVEVANKSKAFALGRYNYLNGVDQHAVPLERHRLEGARPARRPQPVRRAVRRLVQPQAGPTSSSDPGSALLVGTCGSRAASRPCSSRATRQLDARSAGGGLPDRRSTWSKGAFIGQEAWLYGTRERQPDDLQASRQRGRRSATKGIRPQGRRSPTSPARSTNR